LPQLVAPPPTKLITLDAPWTPFKFAGERIDDDWANALINETLFKIEAWRTHACDNRWKLNDWLYFGRVPQRLWEGTSIPRANYSLQVAFDHVEAAYSKLVGDLLSSDEIVGVFPEGQTHPLEAQQIRDRLLYILDHNLDDYGQTGRMELSRIIKDILIYGNGFGLVEYDGKRRQSTILRVDPRDVYIDVGLDSPYVDSARAAILRRRVTVDDAEGMRSNPLFHIPSKEELYWLSTTRQYSTADNTKSSQEASRAVQYVPPQDDWLPFPSSRFIDLYLYFGGGREIWQLGRNNGTSCVIYNEPQPYGCMRLVSAPCIEVPNRFYAQSYIDVLDPIQQIMTGLINRHLDELALALNPPRAAKRGVTRTPSALAWRPGLVTEFENPKNDMVVFQPQGITQNIWQTLSYFDQQAQNRVGSNSLSSSGMPTPSNANRTRGGMQIQMQAPTERIAKIASNFEQYLLVPMLYKMLKIEKVHATGEIYGKRSKPYKPISR
jgi:hypothetical protein